jgi:lipopolysaccharide export system protein LptA
LKAARFSCLSCLIVFAALFMAPTAGAVTNEEAIRPVVHEGSRADRGRQVLLDGEKVNQLVGNVHIWRDSFSVFCDSALNYVESNQYDFFDKVRVIRGRTILTCESAFYNRNTGDAEFHDKVRVIDGEIIGTSRRGEMKADGEIMRMIREARLVTPDYVVWGDTITRFEDTEEGEAHGHVRIVDPTAETLVTGGHAIFSGDGSTAIVDRDPELTSREQGSDPVISNARIMHFFPQRRSGRPRGFGAHPSGPQRGDRRFGHHLRPDPDGAQGFAATGRRIGQHHDRRGNRLFLHRW